MRKNDSIKIFVPGEADSLAQEIQQKLDGEKFQIKKYNLENPDPHQLVEVTVNVLKKGKECNGVCAIIHDEKSAQIQIATAVFGKNEEELIEIKTHEMVKTPTVRIEKRKITFGNLLFKDPNSGEMADSKLIFEIIN